MTSAESSGSFAKVLRRYDVFLLGVVATFNLNLVPPMATTGWAMPLLMLATVVGFVVPQGVAVVELNRRFPGEGGMAEWVRFHFGDFAGFLTAWCYWANNVVYIPWTVVSIVANLVFLASGETNAAAIHPAVMIAGALVAMWIIVGFSVVGFGVSRWLSNAGGVGMLLALAVLVVLCVASGAVNAEHLAPPSLPADFVWFTALASFGRFSLALVGPELSTVVGDEIKESAAVVPWTVWRVAMLAVGCYLLAAGVLQISIPYETLRSISEVIPAASIIAERAHALWVVAPLGWIFCLSLMASQLTWFAGASRMLWVAAHDGSLPAKFAELHPRLKTPVFALLVQGAICTAVLIVNFAIANHKQVSETLLNLAVILQLIPFLTMFAGLLRAGLVEQGPHARWFALTGGIGVLSMVAGISLAFVPSADVTSIATFELSLAGGCLVFLGSCAWIFVAQRRRAKEAA